MTDIDQTTTTMICDLCGSSGEKDAAGPFDHGSLHIRGALRSSQTGIEGLDGRSRNFDLCRRCTDSLNLTTESDKPAELAQWNSA